ncbi:MAG: RNA 2',3'-cyclic phosphodiesterase [Gammaproteobacteria bacterium]|nr:RNA 2',3'-cyclic phosphodiesterase [Gammaproteobacteria bacterium]
MPETAPTPSPESPVAVEYKRVFLALWPDEQVRQLLHAYQKKLKHEPAMESALRSARAVIPENLHMTLNFIGSISLEVLQALENALDSVQGKAFDMEVNTVSYFPRPKVLWLGVAQIPLALRVLEQQITAGVQQSVEGYECQSFKPHITLFRKAKSPREFDDRPAIHWPVNSFALVESKTYPEGVKYNVLKQWPLSPPSL